MPENYRRGSELIERMLADYRSAYGFGTFCLRYFNASGADPAGGIGELRENETHLIPRAMMALQGYVSDFAGTQATLFASGDHWIPRAAPEMTALLIKGCIFVNRS